MENLLLKGRYKKDKENIFFFNTGSGVSLCFQGKSFTFNLGSINKPCFVYIIKDFDFSQKEKFLVDKNESIKITFHDDKAHYIDLVKANEAIDNTLVLKSIEINGKILKYAEKPNKYVKVYGDSSVAGYGILKHSGIPDYDTSDGVEDFCFRALYNLHFNYDIFCASGWGVTFSPYTNPMTVGIEKYRDRLCVKNEEKWVNQKADLLLFSLGTNDFSYINQNLSRKDELERKFIDSYCEFVKKERELNPNAPVLMVYGSLKEECVYPLIEKTYIELSKVFDNLYIVKLPGNCDGIDYHCHVSHHKEMAEVLAEKIVSIIK